MHNNKKISLVIPCYNEEGGLKKILQNKPFFIDEIIVVDNNSTDRTADIARKYGTNLVYEKGRGYGWAYQAGLPRAKGDIIVTMDGDNSYHVSEIEKLLSVMEKGRFDFVSGCRYPLKNKNAQCLLNKIANYFISWLIRILFRINLMDSQSGMMAFKKSLLDKIKAYNTSMGFSQEIKIKAFTREDVRCSEVHICYGERIGKVKFKKMVHSIENIYSVLRLRKGLL